MTIKENLNQIKNTFINPECKIVAVSKTKPVSAIMEAYEAGVRDFGENKIQELMEKAPKLPQDIRWHMIGHVQRNKVKMIAPFIHLIHGVDSFRLVKQIEKEGEKVNRIIPCLLQIHIAKEENKYGLDEAELEEIVFGDAIKKMSHIKIIGLMGMATNTKDQEVIRREFSGLKKLFDSLKVRDLPAQLSLEELSMGMSADYLIAQEEGSSIVRIGTAIFGERNYT